MLFYYFRGLALGAAIVLPLGPQNTFVMSQGVHRQYHIIIALLCTISDLVLIYAGVLGGSALLMQSSRLLALVTWDGVVFLPWHGLGAPKTAMNGNIELADAEVLKQGRWKIITTMLTVTQLNLYVYLNTFVALGSLDGQFDVGPKRWFTLGVTSASLLWSFGLAILAAWLAPRLHMAKSQRITNPVVGCVMWFIASQPTRDDTAHAQTLFSWALSNGKIKQRR